MSDKPNIDLDNPAFRNLWKLINYTDNSVFLTGKAGTGKSTFLKYITANTKKKHIVLAPTGIAAVNVGGMTLHSFFNLPFKPLLPDDPEFTVKRLRNRLKYTKQKQKLIKTLDLIIIDEISMVRADIIDFIDKVLRVYSNNMREPFGGKQILFVGDMFQLEPVVTADMRDILRKYYRNSFFFSARVFSQMNLVSIELQKVYRQTDTEFISMLDRIRMGKVLQSDIDTLNGRLKSAEAPTPENDRMTMTLAARRDTVDYINQSCLESLDTPLITYKGSVKGDFPESSLPTSLELQVKEGAQVVFIKNDRDQRWVNGSLGKIVVADDKRLEIELENGDRHVVDPEIWENIKYSLDEKSNKVIEKVIGEFTQYPIRLAWALTIHKSQGLTFNNVDIDIGQGAFTSGQTYVALSRCRNLEGLGLKSTIAPRDIFLNPALLDFSRFFNDEMLIKRALDQAHADDCFRRAAKMFDQGDATAAWDILVEGLRHRSELTNDAAMRLVRIKLGIIESQRQKIERLESKLTENAKTFDKLASEYVSLGYDCLEDGGFNLAPALANFNKALSLSPQHEKALTGKIKTLDAMGEKAEAAKCRQLLKKIGSEKRKRKH